MSSIPIKKESPLYEFAKKHLAVVNALVLFATSVVGVLDFLAPKVSLLPKLVYGTTAAIVALMVLAAVFPELLRRAFAALGFAAMRDDLIPMWRKPAWQLAVGILTFVTLAGIGSMAKASQGGAMASAIPEIRVMQTSLLALSADTAVIKTGVDAANSKLDVLVEKVDPANPADLCPDITCAVTGGASVAALKKLFKKGETLPPNAIHRGVLLAALGQSASPNRMEVLDVLFANGLDVNLPFNFTVLVPASATPVGAKLAKEVLRLANYEAQPTLKFTRFPPPTGDASVDAWSDLCQCLMESTRGIALIELAAMRGDQALYAHLSAIGARPPSRPLVCKSKFPGGRGDATARVVITNGQAKASAG